MNAAILWFKAIIDNLRPTIIFKWNGDTNEGTSTGHAGSSGFVPCPANRHEFSLLAKTGSEFAAKKSIRRRVPLFIRVAYHGFIKYELKPPMLSFNTFDNRRYCFHWHSFIECGHRYFADVHIVIRIVSKSLQDEHERELSILKHVGIIIRSCCIWYRNNYRYCQYLSCLQVWFVSRVQL